MQDLELVQLCKTIYRKHRDAIDLVVQHGASSQVLEGCEEVVKQLGDLEFYTRTSSSVWFLTSEMAKAQREILTGWSFLTRRFPVMCWFHYRKKVGKLQLSMEVGPLEDHDLRAKLLTSIKEAGFKVPDAAIDPSEKRKFTRILTEVKRLKRNEQGEPDDSPEYVKEVAEALWEKAWGEGKKIVGVLESFDWGEG